MHAGNDRAAMAALQAYLELHAGSGYVRPLVCLGRVASELLGRLLDTGNLGPLTVTAERLRSAVQRGRAEEVPQLTRKQQEILVRLPHQRDKEIANALGLSVHGVRYHIRNIFRKLNVSDRADAGRRAHSLGILPNKLSQEAR